MRRSRRKNRSVIVIGGGYAGLACLIELHRLDPSIDLHLFDPHREHCRITDLHKTLKNPLSCYCTPYATLADRFRFRHHRLPVPFAPDVLSEWNNIRSLHTSGKDYPFDALVVATGAIPRHLPGGKAVLDLGELRKGHGMKILEEAISSRKGETFAVTVVGGGASGIQLLFEIHNNLTERKIPFHLRLVDRDSTPLSALPAGFGRHVLRKMSEKGIEHLPSTVYREQYGGEIRLEEAESGEGFTRDSNLTLLLPGVAPHPFRIETSESGEVLHHGKALANVYAAGDCSFFHARGLNSMTAQAALWKGKHVARNIHRRFGERPLAEYDYREEGYFVSLGPWDAVGWLGFKPLILKGKTAYLIKESIELRYDLFLQGFDTFLPLPFGESRPLHRDGTLT